MKKLILLMAVMFSMAFVSCTGCADKKVVDNDSIKDSTATVENIITMDKEYMNLNFKGEYKWFETCILMADYLDSENTSDSISGISNIFQTVEKKGEGFDTQVIMFSHVGDSTQIDIVHSFWVEDMPMDSIKLTFKEAYEKVIATNLPKPHSRNCVLRKELGPNNANPQYIFGNSKAQIYVDAITGDVTDKNPVYPSSLKMPLGEWP